MSLAPTPDRITPLSEQEWENVAQDLPESLVRFSRVGQDRPIRRMFAVLGHHPRVLRRWMPFVGVLLNGTLGAREREIVILRTVWLCKADYEWGPHLESATAAGVTGDEIARITVGPVADEWSSFDRALLQAADELHCEAHISDATWKVLSGRLDERQLIELVMVVGNYHVAAFAVNTLGISVEDGFDAVPR